MEEKRLSEAKADRVLTIYSQLVNGAILNKADLAQQFHVTQRSIQRDIESLRCFFAEQGLHQGIIYDKRVGGYHLIDNAQKKLSNSEVLAVCKILLESRSMVTEEMMPILDRLINCCVPEENKTVVQSLLANERFHYVPPHHGRRILDGLWEIGQAVRHRKVMEIQYERMKEPRLVTRRVEPVGIMFSGYYFYLTAFIRDVDRNTAFENEQDLFPTIYRIDRIHSFQVLKEHFHVPYKDRFEEGEFRKRIQFMYGGKLKKIRFRYTGPSLEAILDRLPTAQVLAEDPDGWDVEAEVFGKGIEMWLRSQGEYVSEISMV